MSVRGKEYSVGSVTPCLSIEIMPLFMGVSWLFDRVGKYWKVAFALGPVAVTLDFGRVVMERRSGQIHL